MLPTNTFNMHPYQIGSARNLMHIRDKILIDFKLCLWLPKATF